MHFHPLILKNIAVSGKKQITHTNLSLLRPKAPIAPTFNNFRIQFLRVAYG